MDARTQKPRSTRAVCHLHLVALEKVTQGASGEKPVVVGNELSPAAAQEAVPAARQQPVSGVNRPLLLTTAVVTGPGPHVAIHRTIRRQ